MTLHQLAVGQYSIALKQCTACTYIYLFTATKELFTTILFQAAFNIPSGTLQWLRFT